MSSLRLNFLQKIAEVFRQKPCRRCWRFPCMLRTTYSTGSSVRPVYSVCIILSLSDKRLAKLCSGPTYPRHAELTILAAAESVEATATVLGIPVDLRLQSGGLWPGQRLYALNGLQLVGSHTCSCFYWWTATFYFCDASIISRLPFLSIRCCSVYVSLRLRLLLFKHAPALRDDSLSTLLSSTFKTKRMIYVHHRAPLWRFFAILAPSILYICTVYGKKYP